LQLRSLSLAAVFLAVMPFALGNIDSPFLHITVMGNDSNLRVTGKNISRSPIVAYVVFAEHGHSRVVWKSVFSVGESLKPGKNVELGNVPLGLASERVNFFVDYVRLADGTEWGDSTTEEAKELAARYQK
jgi:GTP-dependent phosphoenolpyruvate carboxykinase